MMASGKKSKKGRSKPIIARQRGVPWLTIGAVAVVLALGVTIGVVVLSTTSYSPSASNQDPSVDITGVYHDMDKYKQALHVQATDRVDYDRYPPVGGPHDGYWAACNGVVYPVAMRDENMVHTLEHGAVWIAYNPDTIAPGDLDVLTGLVQGEQFMVMSPYPTLTKHPISLQAWGHQLQVDSASDERVQQFITALRRNPYVYPETGATCDQPSFPTTDIPDELRFDASPRGADAIPLDGGDLAADTSEMPAASASGSAAAGG